MVWCCCAVLRCGVHSLPPSLLPPSLPPFLPPSLPPSPPSLPSSLPAFLPFLLCGLVVCALEWNAVVERNGVLDSGVRITIEWCLVFSGVEWRHRCSERSLMDRTRPQFIMWDSPRGRTSQLRPHRHPPGRVSQDPAGGGRAHTPTLTPRPSPAGVGQSLADWPAPLPHSHAATHGRWRGTKLTESGLASSSSSLLRLHRFL